MRNHDDFLAICAGLPVEVQRCMMGEYGASHRAECASLGQTLGENSPHDEGPQLPFRMIISGLDTWNIDECPQCVPMLEDVRAASADTVNTAIRKLLDRFHHAPSAPSADRDDE